VSKWTKVDEYHWRLGRYFVNRARVFDDWIFLGVFKAYEGAAVEIVSPERRFNFEDAARDCMAHAKSLNPQQRRHAA
jgi:hypothetical protein